MDARLGTAGSMMIGPILDADGVAKTDEVVASILASKNGGDPAALDGAATLAHKHTGNYLLTWTANDVNALGLLQFTLSSGTNTMQRVDLHVLPALVWDALYAASGGKIPASVGSGDDVDAAYIKQAFETVA